MSCRYVMLTSWETSIWENLPVKIIQRHARFAFWHLREKSSTNPTYWTAQILLAKFSPLTNYSTKKSKRYSCNINRETCVRNLGTCHYYLPWLPNAKLRGLWNGYEVFLSRPVNTRTSSDPVWWPNFYFFITTGVLFVLFSKKLEWKLYAGTCCE